MNRILIALAILFFQLNIQSIFAQDEVKVSLIHPAKVKKGESFTVELVFNKAGLVNFAEYIQNIPSNMQVHEVNSGAAIFESSANSLSYTWIRLPREKKFSLSYELTADSAGEFHLNGEFYYIYNNIRGSYVVDSKVIVDDMSDVSNPIKEGEINSKRDKIFYITQSMAIVVLKISQQKPVSNMTVTETFNDEVSVNIIDSSKAKVEVKGKELIFSWDKTPDTKEIVLTYKIQKKKPEDKFSVDGSVSYQMSNSKTKVLKTQQRQ